MTTQEAPVDWVDQTRRTPRRAAAARRAVCRYGCTIVCEACGPNGFTADLLAVGDRVTAKNCEAHTAARPRFVREPA